MGKSQRAEIWEKVIALACEDGVRFFDEHREPLDTNESDWSSQAWREAYLKLGLSETQADAYWPHYRSALVTKTEELWQATIQPS